MYLDLTPDQQKFQHHCRDYFARFMTPEFAEEMRGSEGGGPLYWQALREMGKDRMLGIGWPEEFGGQGRSPLEQFIFADEAQRSGFPFPFLTLNTVGPTIREFGTEEQKAEFLPRIMAGEINFSIGYSEPNAGTDLASLTTRAERSGDDWVINGQKIWTSLANYCQYVWLAARTDPNASKHRGISMFIVPTDAPGFSLSPIMTMGGVSTNATFYENVRVPGRYLVGGENMGWTLITNQLNHERVALNSSGPTEQLIEDARRFAIETRLADGERLIDREWVQTGLATCRTRVEVLRLMNWKVASLAAGEAMNPATSSAVKVFGSESFVDIYQILQEIIGQAGYLVEGSPGAVLAGRLERMYRSALVLTFGGGTNEIQRDIIAMAGLGLPHYKS